MCVCMYDVYVYACVRSLLVLVRSLKPFSLPLLFLVLKAILTRNGMEMKGKVRFQLDELIMKELGTRCAWSASTSASHQS